MQFVIPSYQRPDVIKNKTLTFLLQQNIDPNDITIVVRDDDEKLQEYMDISCNIVTTSVKGIGKTHNFITEYFAEDTWICECDDDIIDMIDNKRQSISSIKDVLIDMIKIMEENNISYGGFYQCDNPKFMSGNPHYTFDLRYCLGLIRLRKVKKDIILHTNYAEDFENCIQHFIKDGKILKNNWCAGKTKNYADGGCDGDGRNINTEKADKEYLANKYPNHCKLFQRKNGRWDLRLIKKPRILDQ
jgi:hypothetical protein